MCCAGIDVSKPYLDLALVFSAAKPTRADSALEFGEGMAASPEPPEGEAEEEA